MTSDKFKQHYMRNGRYDAIAHHLEMCGRHETPREQCRDIGSDAGHVLALLQKCDFDPMLFQLAATIFDEDPFLFLRMTEQFHRFADYLWQLKRAAGVSIPKPPMPNNWR